MARVLKLPAVLRHRAPALAALAFVLALALALPAARAAYAEDPPAPRREPASALPDGGQGLPRPDLPAGRVRVIISLDAPAVTQREGAERAQQLAAIDSRQDAVLASVPASARLAVRARYQAIPALVAEIDAASLPGLRALPGVRSVVEDWAEPKALNQGRALIKADQVHALGITGQGVTVAVIDDGVDTDHPDLANDLAGGMCFVAPDGCPGGVATGNGLASAEAVTGHGTHVTGIITGDGNVAPRGVAPGAKVWAYNVFGPYDSAFVSDQLLALDHILNNRPEVRAVNMSLGGGRFTAACDSDPRASVFAALRNRGTLVIVAAGNNGFGDALSAPACLTNAVSVGAVADNDAVASFSNSTAATDANGQPLLDLLAPGVSITAPWIGGGAATLNGTSMATPHVTGAVALLFSAFGTLTAADVESALESAGAPILAGNGVTTPRVDVHAALQSLRCGSVTLSSNPSPAQAITTGTAVALTASASGCSGPQYRFWHQRPDGSWSLLRDWGVATFSWDTTGEPGGSHRVDVHARRADSALPADAAQPLSGFTLVVPAPCTDVTLVVSPTPPPHELGTILNFTASATGCTTAQYRFWHQRPDETWELLRDWGTSGALAWNTASQSVGAHRVDVHARALGSGGVAQAARPLTGITLGRPCTSVDLGASPSSPQTVGATVVFAAGHSGLNNCGGSVQYRYWHQRPDGSWRLARDWSMNSQFAWDTSSEPAGTHRFDVHARQGQWGPAEAAQPLTGYVLNEPAPCTSVGLTPSAASPREAGSSVTFTASASGCTSPQYRFWHQRPDGSWRLARDWAAGATFTWDTAGEPLGAHRIDVHARAQFSGGAAQAAQPLSGFQLTGCTSVSLNPGAASPQQAGAIVNFTASASGCTSPEYRFWHQRPSGAWELARDWGGATFAWDTLGEPLGAHRFDVHARHTGSGGGAQAALPLAGYQLDAATPCSGISIGTNQSSPQTVGSTVTFTASTFGCANQEYRFWHRRPDGSWSLARDWALSDTFAWNTAGEPLGAHRIDVHSRPRGTDGPVQALPFEWGELTAPAPCTAVSLSRQSEVVGAGEPASYRFTGSAGGCASAEYRFWHQLPSGAWELARDWGTDFFIWSTGGQAPGTHRMDVHARAQFSGAAAQAAGPSSFELVCPSGPTSCSIP